MENFILTNYDKLKEGIYGYDIIELKPPEMTDRKFYLELNKICKVLRRGEHRKTFYKLTDENEIRLNPEIVQFAQEDPIHINIDLLVAFEYNVLNPTTKRLPRERKMKMLFYMMFQRARFGSNGFIQVFKEFPREKWELVFYNLSKEFSKEFKSMFGTGIRILKSEFSNDFRKSLSLYESIIGKL